MKRKLLHIASVLCAALVAGMATGCSSPRKAQNAAGPEESGAVEPERNEEHRVRVLYGVPDAKYRKLDR